MTTAHIITSVTDGKTTMLKIVNGGDVRSIQHKLAQDIAEAISPDYIDMVVIPTTTPISLENIVEVVDNTVHGPIDGSWQFAKTGVSVITQNGDDIIVNKITEKIIPGWVRNGTERVLVPATTLSIHETPFVNYNAMQNLISELENIRSDNIRQRAQVVELEMANDILSAQLRNVKAENQRLIRTVDRLVSESPNTHNTPRSRSVESVSTKIQMPTYDNVISELHRRFAKKDI